MDTGTTERPDCLWSGDAPLYQPLLERGIRYREPFSGYRTEGWFEGRRRVRRERVASLLGVAVVDVLRWEEATDLEAEEYARDNDWD